MFLVVGTFNPNTCGSKAPFSFFSMQNGPALSCANTAFHKKILLRKFLAFEKVLGIRQVEKYSWLFPLLRDAGGTPELACRSVSPCPPSRPSSWLCTSFVLRHFVHLRASLLPSRQPPVPQSGSLPGQAGCLAVEEGLVCLGRGK